jgi:hypothetical protein
MKFPAFLRRFSPKASPHDITLQSAPEVVEAAVDVPAAAVAVASAVPDAATGALQWRRFSLRLLLFVVLAVAVGLTVGVVMGVRLPSFRTPEQQLSAAWQKYAVSHNCWMEETVVPAGAAPLPPVAGEAVGRKNAQFWFCDNGVSFATQENQIPEKFIAALAAGKQ